MTRLPKRKRKIIKYICVIKVYTFEKIKYGIKYCENIRVTLRLQLLHVKSHVVSKFLWKSRSLFARNCRAKLSVQNKQDSSSFPIRFVEYRGSSVAIHAGTIYFYLGRKSPVVMEIYRGLNIDIGARQRRSEMSLNRNLESLCLSEITRRKNTHRLRTIVYLATHYALPLSRKRLSQKIHSVIYFSTPILSTLFPRRFNTIYSIPLLCRVLLEISMYLGKHFAAVTARYVGNEVSDGSFSRATCKIPGCSSKLHDGPRTKRTN